MFRIGLFVFDLLFIVNSSPTLKLHRSKFSAIPFPGPPPIGVIIPETVYFSIEIKLFYEIFSHEAAKKLTTDYTDCHG